MNQPHYFKKGTVEFFMADSEEFVKKYPDNHFDLLIADPPYGIGMSGRAGHTKKTRFNYDKKWDEHPISKEFFIELFRVSKNQIVFGANHFIDNLPEPRNSPSWIIWDKRENIIPERTFADAEIAWTSFKTPVRIFRHYWDGFLQRVPEYRIHPTQKPVALYEWCLSRHAIRGDKILDPFGGSMSNAIACYNLEYQLSIIEDNEEIFNRGVERFKNITAQQKLKLF